MGQRFGIAAACLIAAVLGMAGCSSLEEPGSAFETAPQQTAATLPSPAALTPAMLAPAMLADTGASASRALEPLVIAHAQQTTTTPIPAISPTPAPLTIRVWWPDELYPPADSLAEGVLTSQFDSFRLTYSAYNLEVRRKRTSGLGGILSTLRTAEPVAPGALPDLTLMRRSDMLTAATEGLILPLAGWIPLDLTGSNLFPGVLALGEIDGQLYGLPYVLNVYHTVYRSTVFDNALATFDEVLAAAPVLCFPGNRTQNSSVSLTVLLQYRAAGGRLVDENNNPVLDPEPLLAVLTFYEQAAARGIVDASLLQVTEAAECWSDFANAEANLIGADAWTYLIHKEAVPNTGLAAIPTLDGSPITSMEGWMWVLTTPDPDRQNQARAFLSWVMRVGQQSLFTEALGVLPSQQRALRLWDDAAYAEFAQVLIMSGEVIPLTQRTGSAAIALQDALTAVLNGTPAADAADAALSVFSAPAS